MSDDYNENEFFSTKPKPVQQRRPRPEMAKGPVPMQPTQPAQHAHAQPVPPAFTMPQTEMPVFPPDPFMQQRPANPLASYFRVPGLNIRLPTGGAYLPQGAFEPLASGDVAVLPMRAADEMLMKNPDALMSGQAIEEMIRSCVPAIKAPHLLSVPDLDVLLLGVRWASYGEKMEVEVNCPKCEHTNTYDADLPAMIGTIKDLPRECPVRLSDDLIAYLRPYNMRNATKLAIAAFEESRRMVFLAEAGDDARMAAMSESYKRITSLNAEMLSDCILYIATPGGNVVDRGHILEFMANTDRQTSQKIDDALKDLNSGGVDKSLHVTCEKCSHEWTTNLEFDPASFFGQGS